MRNRASAHPSIESLEDVKVQVHTYDAEMGRTGGGVFNTTLKSGTNTFRGNGFYQVRPIWGQTNNYFGEMAGRPKPESPYRLAGGAVGGPIVKNKTFFWFTTEGYDDTQTGSVSVLFPTAAMRSGDFSALTNCSRTAGHHLRPADGSALPGQPDSGQPYQPGGGQHAAATCRCPTRTATTAATTTRERRSSRASTRSSTRSSSSTRSPTAFR